MSEKEAKATVDVEEKYRPGIMLGVALSRHNLKSLVAYPNQEGGTTFESETLSQAELEDLLTDCRFRIIKQKP